LTGKVDHCDGRSKIIDYHEVVAMRKNPDDADSFQSSRRLRQWADPATDGDKTIYGLASRQNINFSDYCLISEKVIV
jgi:hypothetical protein